MRVCRWCPVTSRAPGGKRALLATPWWKWAGEQVSDSFSAVVQS
jgi:hypothetical protein